MAALKDVPPASPTQPGVTAVQLAGTTAQQPGMAAAPPAASAVQLTAEEQVRLFELAGTTGFNFTSAIARHLQCL